MGTICGIVSSNCRWFAFHFGCNFANIKKRKYLYLLLMLGIIRLTTRLPRASLFQIKKNLEQHSNLAQNAVLVRKLSSIMSMLQPATPAPEFGGKAVVDGQIKDIKLADYQGKYVVLLFYPADFTFVCPTEIISFSERAAEFRKENCEVIAVSTDSEFSHLAWINTAREAGGLGKMDIPLLADRTQDISTRYGVLKNSLCILGRFRSCFPRSFHNR